VEDLLEVSRVDLDVDRVHGRPVAQDPEEEHDEGQTIVADQRDALTGARAPPGQELGHTRGETVQLGEGEAPGRIDRLQIDALAEAPGVVGEQGVEVRAPAGSSHARSPGRP
jgi:hypothetical protein